MKSRELVIFPLIITILGSFLYLIGDTINVAFLRIFLPQSNTIFEFLKIYFTSFLIIYICGLFTDEGRIKNYLFSRVVGSIVMMVITVLLGSFVYVIFKEVSAFLLLIIFLLSIWGGQFIALIIQSYNIKYGKTLAIILQTLVTLLITFYTIYPLDNYLFK